MEHDDVPIAVLPLPYAERAGAFEWDVRVARSLAYVGLVYGFVRIAVVGVYVLARWGDVGDLTFYQWDTESLDGLLLFAGSGVVHVGLVVASLLLLRLAPAARGAMLAYAAGAALLWAAEIGVEAYYNFTGYYGDDSALAAAWTTLQDIGLQSAELTFPALAALLLMRRDVAGVGRMIGR